MRKQTPCVYHKTGIVLYQGCMDGLMCLSHCLRTDYETGASCDKPPKKEKFTQKQKCA